MSLPKVFIDSIRENDLIQSVFLVKFKAMPTAKNGRPYVNLILTDRTGDMEARIWDNAESLSLRFEADDFVMVRGRASLYQGRIQLVLQDVQKVERMEVDYALFIPVTQHDPEKMFSEMRETLQKIDNPWLKKLAMALLDDTEMMARYKKCPAAKSVHHVYIGGLLEHSLSVCRVMGLLKGHYPTLNYPLLVFGAAFHDIGKIYELTWDGNIAYSDVGKLVGHIVMGVEILARKIALIPGFPDNLAAELKHLLISHHGQYEYGSPKQPMTVEAFVLNLVDDLDSKVNGIQTFLGKETKSGAHWSSYHKIYDRYFYKSGHVNGAHPEEGGLVLDGADVRSHLGDLIPDAIKKQLTRQVASEPEKADDSPMQRPLKF